MPGSNPKTALSRFFRDEYQNLVGYVKRRLDELDRQDAEDLVQDLAANLFNKADIAAPIENLSAYAYGALRNRIIDHFRRKRKTVSLDDPLTDADGLKLSEVVGDLKDRAVSEIERMEAARELYMLLDGLKEDEKAILIATEIEGRAFRDLAEKWQVPINTLLSRKARAMKKIQRQLGH